uniref:hypothetical protein n=1 Tax=Candidatus Limisoma sp. TaxID=3076476 RepID=UPI004027E871
AMLSANACTSPPLDRALITTSSIAFSRDFSASVFSRLILVYFGLSLTQYGNDALQKLSSYYSSTNLENTCSALGSRFCFRESARH